MVTPRLSWPKSRVEPDPSQHVRCLLNPFNSQSPRTMANPSLRTPPEQFPGVGFGYNIHSCNASLPDMYHAWATRLQSPVSIHPSPQKQDQAAHSSSFALKNSCTSMWTPQCRPLRHPSSRTTEPLLRKRHTRKLADALNEALDNLRQHDGCVRARCVYQESSVH